MSRSHHAMSVCISLSSTIKCCGGPMARLVLPPWPQLLPILDDGDCHIDYGSSASIVNDDSKDTTALPSCYLLLPFDLNLPADLSNIDDE
jgi:hypothetical protein